jgi:hypothetical protein
MWCRDYSKEANMPKYPIKIDGKPFQVSTPCISGLELKKLAGVDPQTYGIWLEVPKGEDRPIANDQTVNLAEKGVERFFTSNKPTTEG